jgi:hypothetical protein
VRRATVAEVVAVDRGNDNEFQAHRGDGARQVFGLVGVERQRSAVGDIAKRASAST